MLDQGISGGLHRCSPGRSAGQGSSTEMESRPVSSMLCLACRTGHCRLQRCRLAQEPAGENNVAPSCSRHALHCPALQMMHCLCCHLGC